MPSSRSRRFPCCWFWHRLQRYVCCVLYYFFWWVVFATVPPFVRQVHIQHVQSNLDDIGERPIEYWRYASAVAVALQREKEAATMSVMTAANDPAEIGLAKKALVAALAQLASYHYTHAPNRKHAAMDISSKPLDGPERHLEVFTATLKLDELATLRMQAFEKRHTHDLKAHTAINKKYDGIVRDLFILSGRQTNEHSNAFSKAQIALLAYVEKLNAFASVEMCASWVAAASDAAEHDAASRVFSKNIAVLEAADAFFEAYSDEEVLIHATALKKQNIFYRALDNQIDSSLAVVKVPGNHTALGPAFECQHVKDDLYESANSLEHRVAAATDDTKLDEKVRLGTAITVVVVASIGVLMHLCSIKGHYNMINQILQSKRELQKLMKSLDRMKNFAEMSIQDHDDTDEGLFFKRKGIPAAEKSLFGVGAQIKQIKAFLPRSLFSDRLKVSDDVLFTELALKPFRGVTVLSCCIGHLNMVSPQEGVPVKQKALEKAMGAALATIVQVTAENGGHVTDVTADYVIICFNLLDKRPKGCIDACSAALEMVEKLQGEGAKTSMGIATGDVLAGNVGVVTLKNFIVVGPTMPLSRTLEKMAMYYSTPCVMDATTNEAVQNETDFQTMPMDVITQDMGAPEQEVASTVVVYKLSAKNVALEEQEKHQHWNRMFSHYMDGDIKAAKAEATKYAAQYGATGLSRRFVNLCTSHPQVTDKTIYDFLEKA